MITDNITGLGRISFEDFSFTYKLGLTNHCREHRISEEYRNGQCLDSVKKERRINKEFTILRIDYIIRPFLQKMMKKDGKYLINVNKNRDSKNIKVLLVAIERGCSSNTADYTITIITALTNARVGDNINFVKIKPENRFVSSEYFDDIIKIPELVKEDDDHNSFNYKDSIKVPDRSFVISKEVKIVDAIPIVRSGFKIVKKGKSA